MTMWFQEGIRHRSDRDAMRGTPNDERCLVLRLAEPVAEGDAMCEGNGRDHIVGTLEDEAPARCGRAG